MRKIVLLISTLLIGIVAHAYDPKIRNIDIKCVLDNTGCAHITEVWDVCVAGGTEWYLVRTNLGEKSRISQYRKEITRSNTWKVGM